MTNKSKHFLILGYGVTGSAVCDYLIKKYSLQNIAITIYDTRELDTASLESKLNSELNRLNSDAACVKLYCISNISEILDISKQNPIDLVVASPGIKPDYYKKTLIDDLNLRIVSDVQLFMDELNYFNIKNNIYAITGTNGKSTVTALLYYLLNANRSSAGNSANNVYIGGNYGVPVTDLLNSNLYTQSEADVNANTVNDYVLELSSYQLELTDNLSTCASVCLNITPDHLEWHGNMEHYINAKLKIYENSKCDIVNFDDPVVLDKYVDTILSHKQDSQLDKLIVYSINSNYKTISEIITQKLNNCNLLNVKLDIISIENAENSNDNAIYINNKQFNNITVLPEQFRIKHNLSNLLSVIALLLSKASINNVNTYLQKLSGFKGLPYRCELVKNINNIKIYNDSKATNLSATFSALESILSNVTGKVMLILSGIVKEDICPSGIVRQKFVELAQANLDKISGFIISTKDKESAKMFIDLAKQCQISNVIIENNFENLLQIALDNSEPYDSVLFSPAGASFDQFTNYMQRGEVFTKLCERV